MNRRKFLRNTAAVAAGAAVAPRLIGGMPVYAGSPIAQLGSGFEDNDNILIVIQLFGGNDGLNTIIPAENDEYHKIRPNLRVPKDQAKRILGSDVFMHPALVNTYKNGLQGLMEEGRLAVVNGVGYENPNLSHFRSTDIWLSGFNSSDPNVRLQDGWVGRFFAKKLTNFPKEIPEHPIAVQIGGTLSMMLQSEKGDMGIALTDPEKFFQLGQGLSPDEEEISGNTNYADEFNFVRTVAKQSDRYSQIVKNAYDSGKNTLSYANGFAQQMGLVARLISGGLRSKVYMVSMGGFDTHVNQQVANLGGNHPALLNALASGISQFMGDALQQGFADRVIGLTVSEFGRRPYENGSWGTDHGASSVQFVFGTRVKSGVYGSKSYPDLKNFDSNGDLVYDVDYRRVYSEVLQTWFGATTGETEEILGEKITPLNVLQTPVPVEENFLSEKNYSFDVTPNPSFGEAKISFSLDAEDFVNVSVFALDGRLTREIFEGKLSSGKYFFPVAMRQSGHYLVTLRTRKHQISQKLSIIR